MADTKVSALTLQTTTDGNELIPVAEPQGTSPETYASKKTTAEALGHQFRGALIELASTASAVDFSTPAPITQFDTQTIDTDGFWAASPNPERLTIPSGKGITHVNVQANVYGGGVTAGSDYYLLLQHKNSGGTLQRYCGNRLYTTTVAGCSLSLLSVPVSAGDYFVTELYCNDTSINLGALGTAFALQVVGMSPV